MILQWLLTHTPLFYLTQSLWRDEVFSIFTAEKPILSFIGNLNFEPPFYYILLHFWIKIFGESEIAVRSLSLVGFTLATIIIVYWSKATFKKHWLSWVTPLLFFLNPMLLYYAFEVRAYGWLIFFSTLSLYAYTQKRFKLLAIANALAFYTHSYGLFLPFIEIVHYLFITYRSTFSLKNILQDKRIHTFIYTGLAISPWFISIYNEMKKNRPTWYFPVDLQLIKSVLGNMFTSYDGTPGGLWQKTALLSLILFVLFIVALRKKKVRRETSFLLTAILLPLCIIIGISFKKPLFVNRYLIYVTIAEIMLLSYAIDAIKNKWFQKLLALGFIVLMICINIYLPMKKAKFDSRSIIKQANMLRKPGDVLYVTSPLYFFEAQYYSSDRNSVFLYNPTHSPFPWYVGETAFSASSMRDQLPIFPKRAIIVDMNQPLTIRYEQSIDTISIPPAQ